jgi:hypothetical protein
MTLIDALGNPKKNKIVRAFSVGGKLRGSFSQLLIRVIDGKPFVFAFTDWQKPETTRKQTT